MYYLKIFFMALSIIVKIFVMATCVVIAIENASLVWLSIAIVLLAAIITFVVWLANRIIR